MRLRVLVPLACVLFSFITTFAGQLPLTVKDISLMLRSGYSSSALLKELSARHFADTVDSAKEKSLRDAGASADLIEALETGTYSLSPEQTAAAQQQMLEQAKRHEAEAERAGKLEKIYQDRLVRDRGTTAKNVSIAGSTFIRDALKGDLVGYQNNGVTRIDDSKLANKKFIAFYFSAKWCGPCRKFTPELVEYYNRVAPQHPEFEVVFVSSDRSAAEMEAYMREANMPWPAIDFQKIPGKAEIKKYAGRGIPCLVLVDSMGKILSGSFDGTQYFPPKKVLADLDKLFAGGNLALQ
jgi:nucleoredoxin